METVLSSIKHKLKDEIAIAITPGPVQPSAGAFFNARAKLRVYRLS
jgi:hypothetical protein